MALNRTADRPPNVPATEPATGRAAWKPMPVRSIQPQRMYEQIAAELTRLIRERDFKPGDRLPPERELAQQLGVSRPSVREAMIALETAGVVEVLTGSGTYVRAIVDEKFRLPWSQQAETVPGIREQFDARRLVEPEVASLAAVNATRDEIAQLAAAVDRADARFRKGDRAEDDDYDFHTTLASASRNTVYAELVRRLWDLRRHPMWDTVRARVVVPEHRTQVISDRRAIVAAVRKRDPAAARKAMKHYMKEAEKRYFG